MAVDIHALCLPQTRASGKVEKQLYQGMLDIPNNELIIVFSENYAIIITPVINFSEVQYEH